MIATKRPVTLLQPYVLEVIALALSLPLTYLNHNRTRTSSTLILLFWPIYVLALAIWGRTQWLSYAASLLVVFYLKGAVVTLGLASLVIECLGSTFAAEDVPKSEHGEDHVASPLLTANIYSIWSFGWMSSLMKKGAKTYITEDDLPSLLPRDESTNLGNKLQISLKKQSVKASGSNI